MKVVCVLKVSKLDVLLLTAPERVEQLRARDPDAYREMVASSDQQRASNARVEAELVELGVTYTMVTRDAFEGPSADDDLVIAVGGDGTVLDVSHRVVGIPMMGINSDPKRSVGYFCAGVAADLPALLVAADRQEVRVQRLHRLSLELDGQAYRYPCMNDLLITNQNPGMMSRYTIRAGARAEQHSSSGIWVSTAAGSTAGIRSAGGTVLPLDGALMQYLVREPFVPRSGRFDLVRGVRHVTEGLSVRSLMDGGRIYVDGPYISLPFGLGASLEIRQGPELQIVGMDPERRER